MDAHDANPTTPITSKRRTARPNGRIESGAGSVRSGDAASVSASAAAVASESAAAVANPAWTDQLYQSHTFGTTDPNALYDVIDDKATFLRYLDDHFRGLTHVDLLKLGLWAPIREQIKTKTKNNFKINDERSQRKNGQHIQRLDGTSTPTATPPLTDAYVSSLFTAPSPFIHDERTDPSFIMPPLGSHTGSTHAERNSHTPTQTENDMVDANETLAQPSDPSSSITDNQRDQFSEFGSLHLPSIQDEPALLLQLGCLPPRADVDELHHLTLGHTSTSASSSKSTSVLVLFRTNSASSTSASRSAGQPVDPIDPDTSMSDSNQPVMCQFVLTTSKPPNSLHSATTDAPTGDAPLQSAYSFSLSALHPTRDFPPCDSLVSVLSDVESLAASRADSDARELASQSSVDAPPVELDLQSTAHPHAHGHSKRAHPLSTIAATPAPLNTLAPSTPNDTIPMDLDPPHSDSSPHDDDTRTPTPTPPPSDPDQILKEIMALQVQLAQQVMINNAHREVIIDQIKPHDLLTYRHKQDEMYKSSLSSYHRVARWQTIRLSMNHGFNDVLLPAGLLSFHRFKYQYDLTAELDPSHTIESAPTGDIFLDAANSLTPRPLPEPKSSVEIELQLAMEAHDYNDYSVCSVCFSTGPSLSSLAEEDQSVANSNPLIFCAVCNVCVHLYCYGIPSVPEGSEWICQYCEAHEPTRQQNKSKRGDLRTTATTQLQTQEPSPSPSPPTPAPLLVSSPTNVESPSSPAPTPTDKRVCDSDESSSDVIPDPLTPAISKSASKRSSQSKKQRHKELAAEAERIKLESERAREANRRSERRRREAEDPLPCCLCTVRGGALKPCDAFDVDLSPYLASHAPLRSSVSPSGRLWAHIVCALWLPRTTVDDVATMQPIHGVRDAWKFRIFKHGIPTHTTIQENTNKAITTTNANTATTTIEGKCEATTAAMTDSTAVVSSATAPRLAHNPFGLNSLSNLHLLHHVNPLSLIDPLGSPSPLQPLDAAESLGLAAATRTLIADASAVGDGGAVLSAPFLIGVPPLPLSLDPVTVPHTNSLSGMSGTNAAQVIQTMQAANSHYASMAVQQQSGVCGLCKKAYGCCVYCSADMCMQSYHPLCAWYAGLYMRIDTSRESTDTRYFLYCYMHTPLHVLGIHLISDSDSAAAASRLETPSDESRGASNSKQGKVQLNHATAQVTADSALDPVSSLSLPPPSVSDPSPPCYFDSVTVDLNPASVASIIGFIALFSARNKLRLLQQREWRNRGRQEITKRAKLARRKRRIRLYGDEPHTARTARTHADGTPILDRSTRGDAKIHAREDQYELGRCAVCFYTDGELRSERNWQVDKAWRERREQVREALALGFAPPTMHPIDAHAPQPKSSTLPAPIASFHAANPLLRCSDCEVEVHAKCLTRDHDVLVLGRGWVAIPDVRVGDEVWSIREFGSDEAEWKRVIRAPIKYTLHDKERLVRLHTDRMNLLATVDHNHWVRAPCASDDTIPGAWTQEKSSELGSTRFFMTGAKSRAAEYQWNQPFIMADGVNDDTHRSRAWCALIGYFCHSGSADDQQVALRVDANAADWVSTQLATLGWSPTGTGSIRFLLTSSGDFVSSSAPLIDFFSSSRATWIFHVSSDQARAILLGHSIADGCDVAKSTLTTHAQSIEQRDELMIIAARAGWPASVTESSHSVADSTRSSWLVEFHESYRPLASDWLDAKYTSLTRDGGGSFTEIDVEDREVFCIEVESGNFLTRRNPPSKCDATSLDPIPSSASLHLLFTGNCYGVQYDEVADQLRAAERRKHKLQRVVNSGLGSSLRPSSGPSGKNRPTGSPLSAAPFSAQSMQNELDALHAQFEDELRDDMDEAEENGHNQWRCRRCADKHAQHEKDVGCALCFRKGGAFKRTDTDSWVHVVCAQWIPECSFGDEDILEPVIGLCDISPARRRLKCVYCRRNGPCIECSEQTCGQAFHPLCGMLSGQIMFEITDSANSCTFVARCRKHTPLHLARFLPLPQDYTDLVWAKKKFDNSRVIIDTLHKRGADEHTDMQTQHAAEWKSWAEARKDATTQANSPTTTNRTASTTPQPQTQAQRRRREPPPPMMPSWAEAQLMMAAATFQFDPFCMGGKLSMGDRAAAAAAAAANANFVSLMFGPNMLGLLTPPLTPPHSFGPIASPPHSHAPSPLNMPRITTHTPASRTSPTNRTEQADDDVPLSTILAHEAGPSVSVASVSRRKRSSPPFTVPPADSASASVNASVGTAEVDSDAAEVKPPPKKKGRKHQPTAD